MTWERLAELFAEWERRCAASQRWPVLVIEADGCRRWLLVDA